MTPPAKRDPTNADVRRAAPAWEARSAQNAGRPLKVLVVEDEPRLRDLLCSAIPEMGFAVTGTDRAEEAIKIQETAPCPVAILDLNLPGMGGLELLEILHRRWPNTSVIILTGFGDLESAKQAIHLDAVDFLTKPASLGELEIALDRARRRLQRVAPRLHEAADAGSDDDRPTTLRDVEREQILAALERNNGNRAATAAELDISVRTLYYRLAKYQQQGYRI